MTAVVTTYILIAKEGLMISSDIATPAGIAVAVIVLAAFLYKIGREDGVTIEEGY
jgi:hypothetical protein